MGFESLLERLHGEAGAPVTPKTIEDAPRIAKEAGGRGEAPGPDPAPLVVALATPNGTCDVTIPRSQYVPEAVAAMVDQCRTCQ